MRIGNKGSTTNHEVSLDELQLARQTFLGGVVGCSVDLVVVVVQTGDVAAGELGDFARRSTNTTSNIKNLHALLDADLVGEVVLMTSNRLVEGLAVREAAKVEGLAPTILIEVGCKVVVAEKWRGLGGVMIWKACRHVSIVNVLSGQSRVLGCSRLKESSWSVYA